MPFTRATIIIKKGDQAAANQWMKDNVDKQGGEFTFIAPLYANNPNTISHYWASGLWPAHALAALTDKFGVDLNKGKKPEVFREAKGLHKHVAQDKDPVKVDKGK